MSDDRADAHDEMVDQFPNLDEPRLLAGIALVERTGATAIEIRYSDDEEPMIWMAVGLFGEKFECAAGPDPTEAVMRLCAQLLDGGTCTRCARATGFANEPAGEPNRLSELLGVAVCWYTWDEATAEFVRSCQ